LSCWLWPAAEENQTTWPEPWWSSTEPTGLQPDHNVDGHTQSPWDILQQKLAVLPRQRSWICAV